MIRVNKKRYILYYIYTYRTKKTELKNEKIFNV